MAMILVEPSEFRLLNIGDIAMQQVAITRLANLCPEFEIHVLSDDIAAFPQYAPNVFPESAWSRRAWTGDGYLFWLHPRIPAPRSVLRFERSLRRSHPEWVKPFAFGRTLTRRHIPAIGKFLEKLRTADMLAICGMGAISDAFEESTSALFEMIATAKEAGVFVAMFGQGIGPLTEPDLIARAREVMPRVDFIALREGRAGVPLLKSWGVASDAIVVTGDDALEVASTNRVPDSGDRVGLNVRMAPYAGVTPVTLSSLQPVFSRAVDRLASSLVPVPTSFYPHDADLVTFSKLVANSTSPTSRQMLSTGALIEQLHSCRILVTGSYHAGVFALAQGVPIVSLHGSPYYRDKFLGLQQQFGTGVEVIDLLGENCATDLEDAIVRSWKNAPELRTLLFDAADRQVRESRRAYAGAVELFRRRSKSS